MQVENLFLQKSLGKGSFGEVFLTKIKNDPNTYATKVYDRAKIEQSPLLLQYLKAEITILNSLNHPNIVKLKEVKKTKRHFYLVQEYCNGGELQKALDRYQKIYNKPFSEEIVQYLMRQIMNAINYLHSKEILHRDIKLENILLNYETEEDKNNFNIMKATIKIIDFGFAKNKGLAISIVGNPMNMDPLILKKLTSNGKIKKLGYDSKIDIWSLGSICYEMIIGRPAFDAEDIDELIDKIEKGDYSVPNNLSKEVVSFLNAMLQYDPNIRLSASQLIHHKFLTENINNFHKINLSQISNKIKNNQIEINTKQNKTIWAIFNKEDEDKLVKIGPGQIEQIPGNNMNNIPQQNSAMPPNMINNNLNNNQPVKNYNTYDSQNYVNMNNMNYFHENNNPNYGPILPPRNNNPIYINQKFENETDYVFSGGIYSMLPNNT